MSTAPGPARATTRARRIGRNLGRVIAPTGLIVVGALHLVWAGGSPWPARTSGELARTVVGSEGAVPSPVASAVVGSGLLTAAALTAGIGGDHRVARRARVAAGLALLSRGVAGGVLACRALGLPDPGPRFRLLDALVYRPFCVVVGLAAVASR